MTLDDVCIVELVRYITQYETTSTATLLSFNYLKIPVAGGLRVWCFRVLDRKTSGDVRGRKLYKYAVVNFFFLAPAKSTVLFGAGANSYIHLQ